MSVVAYIECDYCCHEAFNGAGLIATAEEARDELKHCGWQYLDGKDKCKWCVKGVPAPARFGGSPRTEISIASNCTSDTTPLEDMQTDESEDSSSAPARRSSCEPQRLMPSSSGESSSMTAGSRESTAQSFVTKDAAYHRASYDKWIKSLIASGLVAGITPTSTRHQSPQQTLDFALSPPGGAGAAEPREGS